MLQANLSLTFDPAWPWSLPGIGLAGLAVAAGVLAVLTVWTYLGAKGMTAGRLALILALRLGALVVACLVVLRPSLAIEEEAVSVPTKLIFLLDYSSSMQINDEFDNLSRWDNLKRIVQSAAVEGILKKLAQEHRIEIVYYQFAEDVKKFDPQGQATGKRTDTGWALNELWQRHGREPNLRGILAFSDGADNGTRFPALEKAAQWRREYAGVCPIHTFGAGRPTTSRNQKDIYFDEDLIFTEPTPVPVKGQLTVRGFVHAPGFEGTKVKASLYLEGPDGKATRLGAVETIQLLKTRGNELSITRDAPATPGEYKATLKIEPVPGELTEQNNAITTYVTVTKEGVSVLWVEGKKRAFESVFAIRHALSKDPQFRVYFVEKLKGMKTSAQAAEWFDFDKKHYDVIVIGDISADRFCDGNSAMFKRIREMVTKEGTGLVMLGGYETFGQRDWHLQAKDLADLWPVTLEATAKPIEGAESVKIEPTDEGLQYMLRVAKDTTASRDLWEKVGKLDGMVRMGTPLPGKTRIHAWGFSDGGKDPLLVSRDVGGGRTLVFGGDTTWRAWRRTPEALAVYERFWTQMILWLAQRDQAEGNVRITLDRRRLPANQDQGVQITVSLHGKGGNRVENGKVAVKVMGPNKEIFEVPMSAKTKQGNEFQGTFVKTNQTGEYQVEAVGEGTDVKGDKIPSTPAKVRFLAYTHDEESLRTAADHEFLAKLAKQGGGQFQLADERALTQFLERLTSQQQAQSQGKPRIWPDWRRNPPSESIGDQLETLWESTALACFLVFACFLCLEWFLRRCWGLV